MTTFAPEPIIMKIRLVAPATYLLLFLVPLFTGAQSIHHFFQDDTLIRNQYYQTSLQKKEQAISSIKEYPEDYNLVYGDQFTLIEKFWKSTRPVTEKNSLTYIQKLVDKLKAADPALQGLDLRVVFSRDWWPNAVSMGDGTISINAGLVFFMQSEAELAFVLGHEIAHYYLNHTSEAIRKMIEEANTDFFKSELKRVQSLEYGKNRELDMIATKFLFSTRFHRRENESEADAFAMNLLVKAGYSGQAAEQTLLLLDQVDDTCFFDPAGARLDKLFDFPEYPFRKRWIQKKSAIFEALSTEPEDEEKIRLDSLKTHPDCQVRIQQLKPFIEKTIGKGENFLVDSAYFHQLRHALFYEIMEHCYETGQLGRSLYYATLLLGKEPENPTAICSIIRDWNDIYQLQKEHKLLTILDTEDRSYTSSLNDLLRMVNQLRLDEILAINKAFCKKYYEQMKDIPAYRTEVKRLFDF